MTVGRDAACMKCGEPSEFVVEATINGDYLPTIYLCREHAARAEEAIRPERRGCSVCGRGIPRVSQVTHVTVVNRTQNYCPECYQAWRDWEKERKDSFRRKREPQAVEAAPVEAQP